MTPAYKFKLRGDTPDGEYQPRGGEETSAVLVEVKTR